MRSRRKARIVLELSPEAIRAVVLGGPDGNRVVAFDERSVESYDDHDELARVASQVVNGFGLEAEVRILLLDPGKHYLSMRLPQMPRRELHEAIRLRAAQEIGDSLEGYRVARRIRKGSFDGQRRVTLLCVPREPLDGVAHELALAGTTVTMVSVPQALTDFEDGEPDAGGSLWADVGGGRTVLTLARGNEPVLSREIPVRRDFDWDDEMARFERQVAVFQEIERSVLYYRQNHDPAGITRVVLCGDSHEVDSFLEQFREPLEERGIRIEKRDALAGVELPEDVSPAARARLALAVRAGGVSDDTLAVVPEVTRRALDTRRRRVTLAVAAGAVSLLTGMWAHSQRIDALDIRNRIEIARDHLDELPAVEDPEPPDGRNQRVRPKLQPLAPEDWSGLIREVGLLADRGIEYDRMELSMTREGPLLSIRGRAVDTRERSSGDAVSDLIHGVQASPYVRSLARVEARTDTAGRGGPTEFSFEAAVSHAAEPGGAS